MAKKKKSNSLHDAYALKNAHEQSLSTEEMAAWDALVAKAEKAKKSSAVFQARGGKISLPQLPPENALPLASLPKQEQAAAIYELAQEGALPLSKAEQTKVSKILSLEEPTLFGGSFRPTPAAAPAVDVPNPLPSEDPRQLNLFDDPRAADLTPDVPPSGAPAGKEKLSGKLKGLIRRAVGRGEPRLPRVAPAPAAAASEVAKKAGFLSKLPRAAKVAGGVGLALGAVDLLLEPSAEMVSGAGDLLMPDRVDRRLERMISGQEQVEHLQRMKAKRDRKLAELTQRNTLLLAQNAPHLFNQLMAGRSLPRGATVIGGEPRTDLVQEVAMGMTQGRFPPPQEGQLPLGGE